ncbi:hypothetical protein JNO04_03070 [Halomonas sp. MC140]|nr:hypothetical protein [Halomonas sp. MC140]MDN7131328.1 hypothetical protein [Halomonas sp. MC140]
MSGPQIIPEKVTSPFQLMAAWFVMLVLLTSVLLTAAIKIDKPDWAAGYLVIFASILILLVIGCVTLMLTKFRPHLQDGKEYAQWLKDKGKYASVGVVEKHNVTTTSVNLSQQNNRNESSLITNVGIFVVNAVGSEEMLKVLKDEGFIADIYQPNREAYDDLSSQEGIWLGCRVRPAVACQVVKAAVKQWPHLKYVHLSNDGDDPPDEVHDEIFIGGSTSAAKRYGIQKWSTQDFENLKESMSRKELHKMVREMYS